MCHFLLILPLLALPIFWFVPLSVALPAYSIVAALSIMIYWYAIQAMKLPIQNGTEGLVGEIGEAIETRNEILLVRIHNEIWQAVPLKDSLCVGDRLEVVSVERRMLRVKSLETNA